MECSSDIHDWRQNVTDKLTIIGIKVLSPTKKTFAIQTHETDDDRENMNEWREYGDLQRVHDYMVPVIEKDLRLVDISDFLIVNMEVTKPTFGTMHELVVANQQKKPIFFACGDRKMSPHWITGLIKPRYIYNNLDEVVDTLYKINKGEIEIDSNRWRILLPEYQN